MAGETYVKALDILFDKAPRFKAFRDYVSKDKELKQERFDHLVGLVMCEDYTQKWKQDEWVYVINRMEETHRVPRRLYRTPEEQWVTPCGASIRCYGKNESPGLWPTGRAGESSGLSRISNGLYSLVADVRGVILIAEQDAYSPSFDDD